MRAKANKGNYPVILLYHQIDPVAGTTQLNHYNININPKIFELHLKTVKRIMEPISFEEYEESIRSDSDVSKRVFITFDDGYRAAIHYGGELLVKYGFDSAWFINGEFIDNHKVFWLAKLMWIYDQGLLKDFMGVAQKKLGIVCIGQELHSLPEKIDWWGKKNYSPVLLELLEKYCLTYGYQEKVHLKTKLYATRKDLLKLSHVALIGNHTFSHPNVRNLSEREFKKEVMISQKVLDNIVPQRTKIFAFPFGQPRHHWRKKQLRLLKEMGYKYVFSVENEESLVSNGIWEGAIPRYQVPSNITTEFGIRDYLNKVIY